MSATGPERPRPGATRLLPLAALAGIVLVTHLGSRDLGRTRTVVEVESFGGPFLQGTLGAPERVSTGVEDTTDGRTDFMLRPALANLRLALPFCSPDGSIALTMRSYTRVHTLVDVYAGGERRESMPVTPMKWDRHRAGLDVAPCGSGIDLSLVMRQRPAVRGHDIAWPEMLVDDLEVESPAGLRLTSPARWVLATVPAAAFAFAWIVGLSGWTRAALAATGAAAALAALRVDAVSTLLAVPRLGPLALCAGVLAYRVARAAAGPTAARVLASVVLASTLAHGAWVFLPGHVPPDIHIHQQRTLDLGRVPLTYEGLLTYGSHFPTPSQDRGAATEALGNAARIPYSPLPNVAYYALHLLGLDLAWAMTAFNAALVSLMAVAVFGVTRLIWGAWAAWVAAALYSVDLAVWHHVGRSHAPAVVGAVLTLAALLLLAREALREGTPPALLMPTALVALAFLGYSASIPLFGIFAALWLGSMTVGPRVLEPRSRLRLATALVLGGLVAGVLFYFHYVPGLLGGVVPMSAEPDRFPARSFFIFHNESRQSLRLWAGGYWMLLLAGLVAAPFALRRASARVRPVLLSWLGAWSLFMLLKELALFSKLLRWAKEDQFLSPLLCLLIAGATGPLKPAWLRWVVTLLVLGGALWLHLEDYSFHANTAGL